MTGPPEAEIRAFAKCRNERLRLPAFLDHYRRLGVGRFFITDNGSTDGSLEYLADQPDVHVVRTAQRFSEARGGTDWLNARLAEFGVGFWCVTVDIDELLVYPSSERAPLGALTAYLDRHGYEALSCLLLDLYPEGPLRASSYEAGGDLLTAAPWFDPAPYVRSPVASCPGIHIRGGMRERVFYPEWRQRTLRAAATRLLRRSKPPCLTKVPLVRWNGRSAYLYANHWVSPMNVAPETGVLLHFKFLRDFHDRAVREVARGEYYNRASEYRRYAQRLDIEPELALTYGGSARFEETGQLVRLGLMQQSDAWAQRVMGTM